MKQLIQKINKANYEYYVLDNPTLADKEWDALYYELLDLEKEKVELMEKIAKTLATIDLEYDDLSPKYACAKCNDTGYVGNGKCDCFDKKN